MSGRPKNTIYIGGIPPQCDEGVLHSYFEPFGEIMQIQLPRIGPPRQQAIAAPIATSASTSESHRGFGFIMYATDDEAESAIDNMHLNEVEGHTITVNLAKPLKNSTNDSRKPIWESEEWIQEFGGGQAETQGESASVMQEV